MDLSLTTFALMSLAIVATPGPTVLLALSNGSRFGLIPAGYGILGAAISDAVLIAAAAFGLGALLAASAILFTVVKWVGVAYLIWLGVQMLRSAGTLGALPERTPVESERIPVLHSLPSSVRGPFGTTLLPIPRLGSDFRRRRCRGDGGLCLSGSESLEVSWRSGRCVDRSDLWWSPCRHGGRTDAHPPQPGLIRRPSRERRHSCVAEHQSIRAQS